jgi:predicted ATPase
VLQLARLNLNGILSFGASTELELKDLNVLIGTNASGKSNLIDVLHLLQSLPNDATTAIREGGGVREWLWKGDQSRPAKVVAAFSRQNKGPIRHELAFTHDGPRWKITSERVEEDVPSGTSAKEYFDVQMAANVRRDQSVLARHPDPSLYPELAQLRNYYSSFRIYRDWTLGRRSEIRRPQPADLPSDLLEPSGQNLAVILAALKQLPEIWQELVAHMARFYDGFQDIELLPVGDLLQIHMREEAHPGLISATRLSEGTLRYLALLAILLHPTPPPLICIEEPELGLHPDLIADLAGLLQEASERTQLFVTTHSEHLIGALSQQPDAVIVAERGEQGTELHRLEPERLRRWLEKYTLGELWRMGEIGGTRW